MAEPKRSIGNIATKWASEHTEFEGELVILSSTPKGKGGWGTMEKRMTYLISGGQAQARRAKCVDKTKRRYRHNGMCEVCGTIFFSFTIDRVWLADPDAGNPVGIPETTRWNGYTDIQAEKAYMLACEECQVKHSLELLDCYGFSKTDTVNKVRSHDRRHPIAVHTTFPNTFLLDLQADPSI